ncbi:MAG: hypothetical protein HQ472_06635 [Ignavibacteria bacterium]|nr:hypothetical protein [Ignavibacteria bacterium]
MNPKILALCFIAVVTIAAGCKTETTAPVTPTADKNSFVGNGAGFTNQLFNCSPSDDSGSAMMDPVFGNGAIVSAGHVTTANNKFSISVTTKFAKPGTYLVSSVDGNLITLQISSASDDRTFFSASGSIVVTSWGAIGERAKGTFQGRLGATTGGEILDITNGQFDCVVR